MLQRGDKIITSAKLLYTLLDQAAKQWPDNIAVEGPTHVRITYRDLAGATDQLALNLGRAGVGGGDRIGIWLRKSIDTIISIFAVLKVGAAYVPIDPTAPVARCGYILQDCAVKATILDERFVENLPAVFSPEGYSVLTDRLWADGGQIAVMALDGLTLGQERAVPPKKLATTDLAYILYTSGSTGWPKGVMHSHANGLSFINWCTTTFNPTPADRFSSLAPFHFDLSILDIFLSIKHGATLVLIDEETARNPRLLASLIADKHISICYATPSTLSLLVQFGNLANYDYSALRLVLFAGEVFPIKSLRALKEQWPQAKYYNLYGPTETNVCTFYPIPDSISTVQSEPFPIGQPCFPFQARVINEDGQDCTARQTGELVVRGQGVMLGYWNLPEQTTQAFLVDQQGQPWYKTGDIVVEQADGNYRYLGRRDRMIKRRGYRVELGEIERCLYQHPAVAEVAVSAIPDEEVGMRVRAFINYGENERPSIIGLKHHCAENLPLYMVPDDIIFQQALPLTSTGKIDYQRLNAIMAEDR